MTRPVPRRHAVDPADSDLFERQEATLSLWAEKLKERQRLFAEREHVFEGIRLALGGPQRRRVHPPATSNAPEHLPRRVGVSRRASAAPSLAGPLLLTRHLPYSPDLQPRHGTAAQLCTPSAASSPRKRSTRRLNMDYIRSNQHQVRAASHPGPLQAALQEDGPEDPLWSQQHSLTLFMWQEFLSEISSVQPSRRLHPATQRLCTLELKMPEYITELQVSLNKSQEDLFRGQHYSKSPVNLNKGARGNTIYLWYKKGTSPGITNIQFSFSEMMTKGLIEAGYEKIDKNLNEGAGGDKVYLWYSKSAKNVPIANIDVTEDADAEAQKFKDGWERLACDLNRNAGGKHIYMWVQREKQTYISEIKTTINCSGDKDNFKNGYIRVDENTNRGAAQCATPPTIFLWYRLTTNSKDAFTDLKVSTNQSEYENYQEEGYQPVNQDLNAGTGGNEVFLWYKKDGSSENPIKAVTVITNQGAVGPYQSAGVNVIEESLNSGNNGVPIYVCFKQ
ncbi:uncharacterized protein LOC120435079 [Oreochromis aureus]|uniref:uncharacterized protein LOC120435079 n=1 Tax=Oreochromis aureus TaxID=47969 RepID=UPI00195375E3|nr:uncharacterized protein LOC120435079 [Oreochromis aureus]